MEGSTEVSAPNRSRSLALRAEIDLQRGDLASAKQLAEEIELDVDAHPYYRFFGLIQERILIAEGKKQEASQSLIQKADLVEQAGWFYGFIAVLILRALAAESQEAGMELLSEALERSSQEGFIRVYADHGKILKPLLMEAAQRGVNPEYIRQILAAIQEEPGKDIIATGIVEQLSEREIEVLRLVSAGLTNREIAEKLYLSLGTIKTHVYNICGKVGVTNRTQAVMLARDLNLI
jgi:LuxR family maltose regulon positive regulatory protein